MLLLVSLSKFFEHLFDESILLLPLAAALTHQNYDFTLSCVLNLETPF